MAGVGVGGPEPLFWGQIMQKCPSYPSLCRRPHFRGQWLDFKRLPHPPALHLHLAYLTNSVSVKHVA